MLRGTSKVKREASEVRTKPVLRIVLGMIAVAFVLLGLGWWVAPALVAPQLGMSLLESVGLSTQIGDMAGFCLTAGFCILTALITHNRVWFYPPVMLFGLAALGRILAWLLHGAALPYDMIAVELTVVILLAVAARMHNKGEVQRSR